MSASKKVGVSYNQWLKSSYARIMPAILKTDAGGLKYEGT